MPLFRKQDKPRFFGGLLGTAIRAASPLAGGALGTYLSSLTANPYALAAAPAAGAYVGKRGGDYLADLAEQYVPFKRGGAVRM